MRLTLRDLIGTLLVVAIGVPYIGYLLNGEMPFVQDPRGMAGVALILGAAAFLVLRGGNAKDRVGVTENIVAGVTLVLGLAALAFAETAAAELLLAVFMAAILVMWAAEVADHAGWVPGHVTVSHHA